MTSASAVATCSMRLVALYKCYMPLPNALIICLATDKTFTDAAVKPWATGETLWIFLQWRPYCILPHYFLTYLRLQMLPPGMQQSAADPSVMSSQLSQLQLNPQSVRRRVLNVL